MTGEINSLINAEITDIYQLHDYWQVITDKGIINVYSQVNSDVFDTVKGCRIIELELSESNYFCIKSDNKQSIVISLKDDIVEHFSIHLKTGETIVE